MPAFKAGEEVVVFLEDAINWALTGLSQGKFTVSADSAGRKTVKRSLDESTMKETAPDASGSTRQKRTTNYDAPGVYSLKSLTICRKAPGPQNEARFIGHACFSDGHACLFSGRKFQYPPNPARFHNPLGHSNHWIYVNPAGSDDISNGSDIAAVMQSFADWEAIDCSSSRFPT